MSILNTIKDKLLNKQTMLILFISIIFITTANYVYKLYVTPKINVTYVDNSEFLDKGEGGGEGAGEGGRAGGRAGSEEVNVYYFYTNWCPHCKTASPIWQRLVDEYTGKQINGYNINFIKIDCENTSNAVIVSKYNVEGYPTIKLDKGGVIYDYNAKPDFDTLVQFLQQSL
jgi:thiol-disulfide isomerase/thioredoxin